MILLSFFLHNANIDLQGQKWTERQSRDSQTNIQKCNLWLLSCLHKYLLFARYPLEQCVHEPERQKTVNCIAQSAFPTIGIRAFIKQRHIQFCRFEVFFLNLLFVGTLWNHVCTNYRRRTTKTVHRISIPRMIVIIRQVLKRVLRCSLRIVKPCLALFLCSYQFIMTPNDQIKA